MALEGSPNTVWHAPTITRYDRELRQGHKGMVLWFTGLSGSGKSTVAHEAEARLHARGVRTYVLDGDNLRRGLNRNLGFSPEDRAENIRRAGEVARLFLDSGVVTLVSFISPYRSDRDLVRATIDEGRFAEVYVRCPLSICETRDPKGLYRKARAGEIPEFTGISAPYEEPLAPELVVDTGGSDVGSCADAVLAFLEEKGIITAAR